MKLHLSFLFVFLVLLATPAFATTYYVATTGNDSADGSSTTPWRTLQHAVDTIANGDTILVKPGTYIGCRMQYPGASGAPKTLKAETAGTVTLNAEGPINPRHSILQIAQDFGSTPVPYWVVDGFTVINSLRYGIDPQNAPHLSVRNCVVHNSAVTGINGSNGDYMLIENNTSYSNSEHGYYMNNSSDYGTQRNNVSYSNAGCGFHHNGDISIQPGDGQMSYWLDERNTAYSNGSGSAYNCDGVSDSKFINNLAYSNNSSGISLYAGDAATGSSNDLVYNNTFCMPSPNGRWAVNIPPGVGSGSGGTNPTGNKIKNNILYSAHTFRGSISIYGSAVSGFESDYNVVVNRMSVDDGNTNIPLSTWQGYGYDTHSILVTDPTTLFVDFAGNNFHLKAGSPAIDHGTTLTEVTKDKDGIPRPQLGAYDIGCYEYIPPTYQSASSDSETSTTNTNYVTKVNMTLNTTIQDDWIIFGFCEFKCPNVNYATFVQLFIDGAGEGQNTRKPVDPTDYLPFIGVKVANLPVGSHTIQLKYRAGNAAAAAYVRNARVCAVRKAFLEFYNVANDNAKALTINSTDIAALTWTPATTGNYLVISTAELNATTTVSTDLQTLYNDVVNDEGMMRAADNGDYTTFMSFNYCANAPAGVPITHKIAGRKMAADPVNHYIRRARILALRLTGGRFAQTAAGSATEQNTTSTTFQQCLTTTWTYGANGNWLFLNSARLNNSSRSYQTEVRVQLNNTSTCGDQLMKPKDVTDLLNYSSIDIRNLTTPRTVDMDWRTTNSAGTAKVKRLRFYGLPLDAQ